MYGPDDADEDVLEIVATLDYLRSTIYTLALKEQLKRLQLLLRQDSYIIYNLFTYEGDREQEYYAVHIKLQLFYVNKI
jgi:hypothetical protein